MIKIARLFLIATLAASSLSSCIPLAAGAAAGYVAHKEGYRVQNPIKKTEQDSPPPENYNQY